MTAERMFKCLVLTAGMLLASHVATAGLMVAESAETNPSPQREDSSVLSNADVMKMLKSGFSESAVIAVIQKAKTRFDLSPAALAELKTAGVPDSVIVAMIEATGGTPQPPTTPAPTTIPPSPVAPSAPLPPPPVVPQPRPLEGAPSEPDRTSRPHFSFKLGGGASYLLVGDFNDHYDSYWNDYLSHWNPTGELKAPQLGFNVGIDAIFHVTRTFGVGIGAGYLRASKDNTYGTTWNDGWSSGWDNDDDSLTLSAIPIRLGFHLFIPFSSKVELFANLSPTLYLAKVKERYQYTSYDSYDGTYDSEFTRDVKANKPGVEGALGLKVNLGSTFSLFLEAGGRYAKLSSFKGTAHSANSRSGGYDWTDATLYYYEYYSTTVENWIKSLTVANEPPVSTTSTQRRNIREANVDFSGAGFRFGFAISF